MEKLFLNPELLHTNIEFKARCSRRSDNICELYRPIIEAKQLSSAKHRVRSAQLISSLLTKEKITDIVSKWFIKLPGSKIEPPLPEKRGKCIIEYLEGKTKRFKGYAEQISVPSSWCDKLTCIVT